MKKTTGSNKRVKNRNRPNLKVDTEAVKTLRTVGDQEAFYFYETIGKPTGEIARNLHDFLDKVETVKSESLVFHLQRGDFQNWIETTLGDSELAAKVDGVSSSNDADVRMDLIKAVKNHIKQLSESSPTISIEDNAKMIPAEV
jgi:hypothetical protein